MLAMQLKRKAAHLFLILTMSPLRENFAPGACEAIPRPYQDQYIYYRVTITREKKKKSGQHACYIIEFIKSMLGTEDLKTPSINKFIS